jgi:hypothetical protein
LVFAKALPTELRALWFAASTISSIWFLYWICYDVLVWNKALTQAGPANYVGLIASVVLVILGTQIGKLGILEKLAIPLQLNLHRNQQGQRVQQIQPPKEEETKQTLQDSEVPSGCKFHLGYLHTRPESVDIPEECLECEHVANCLSPTARTIEYASS